MRLQIDPEQQRLMMMLLSVGLFLHMTNSQMQHAAVEMKKILHLLNYASLTTKSMKAGITYLAKYGTQTTRPLRLSLLT